jgi:cytochrome c biogenesis protein CcdA
MPIENISHGAALVAGLLSFFSPCILPLVPAYFTFITGFSLEELTGDRRPGLRGAVVRATLAYVSGFSLVFIPWIASRCTCWALFWWAWPSGPVGARASGRCWGRS